jgi:hypothetical protein
MPGALEAHLAGVAENNPALKPVLNDYTLANDLDRQPHATHVGSRGLSSRSVSSWATKARRDSVVNIAGSSAKRRGTPLA